MKNPLAEIFGKYLQHLRKQSGKAASEVAETLQLSNAFYRLVESGSSSLNPGKIFFTSGTFLRFNNERATHFLTAIHFVDLLMKDQKLSSEMALGTLAERDVLMNTFLKRISVYTRNLSNLMVKKQLFETIVLSEINSFLKEDSSLPQPEDRNLAQILKIVSSVPSFHLKTYLEFTEKMVGKEVIKNFKFDFKDDETLNSITGISVWAKDISFLETAFPYLLPLGLIFRSTFLQFKIIISDDNHSDLVMKEKVFEALLRWRKDEFGEKEIQDHSHKIEAKVRSAECYNEIKDIMPNHSWLGPYGSFLLVDYLNSNSEGYAGVQNSNGIMVNLNYEKTYAGSTVFQKFWYLTEQ